MGCLCPIDILIQETLENHNHKRALHKSEPLKINEELNKLAVEYAKQISKGNSIKEKLYNGIFLGENIYIYKGEDFDVNEIKEMCNDWYNEINKYDKQLNQYQKNTSHFTQMIWKGTKELGFGFVKNKKDKDKIFYAVALYYPPGNILGEYKENVIIPDDNNDNKDNK